MKKIRIALLAVSGLVLAGSASAAVLYPVNNGFELPDLGSGSGAYAYAPASTDWTYTALQPGIAGAGIAANGSAFGVQNATNGDSSANTSTAGQAGVLQMGDGTVGGAAIYQTVSGFTDGLASVTFSIESRGGGQGDSFVKVMLDGQDLGTYQGASTTTFDSVTTPDVAVSAGSHTLYFISYNPAGGDNTQFIDNPIITETVPEPASLGILGTAGLLLMKRRTR